jgi:GT2 family glycosyltransferase
VSYEPRVSALIPHRNSGELLGRCVEALEAGGGVDEIVVADEASTDGSVERVAGRAGVRVIPSERRGYAAALNAGIEAARGRFLLLMNSDAFIGPGTAERLRRRLEENPRVALCGAALVDEHGERTKTHSYRLTLRRALLDAIGVTPPLAQQGDGLTRVEAVFPTCTMARREALEEMGPFDERFRFSYEDMDMAMRLAAAGWEQAVDWEAEAVHVGGGSTSRHDPQSYFRTFHESRLTFLRKHYPRGWRLYAVLWALKASALMLGWTARVLVRRARGDRAGAGTAREWARAFRRSVVPQAWA